MKFEEVRLTPEIVVDTRPIGRALAGPNSQPALEVRILPLGGSADDEVCVGLVLGPKDRTNFQLGGMDRDLRQTLSSPKPDQTPDSTGGTVAARTVEDVIREYLPGIAQVLGDCLGLGSPPTCELEVLPMFFPRAIPALMRYLEAWERVFGPMGSSPPTS